MLTDAERLYFKDEFNALHSRITAGNEKRDERIGELTTLIHSHAAASCPGAHPAARCPDVDRHVAKCHDPVKQWGMVSGLVAAGHGLAWLLKSLRLLGL